MPEGGEPSAPATPGLTLLSYTTPRDAALPPPLNRHTLCNSVQQRQKLELLRDAYFALAATVPGRIILWAIIYPHLKGRLVGAPLRTPTTGKVVRPVLIDSPSGSASLPLPGLQFSPGSGE
jgi:hypothetical protein